MTKHHKNSNLSMAFQGEYGRGIQALDKIPDDKNIGRAIRSKNEQSPYLGG